MNNLFARNKKNIYIHNHIVGLLDPFNLHFRGGNTLPKSVIQSAVTAESILMQHHPVRDLLHPQCYTYYVSNPVIWHIFMPLLSLECRADTSPPESSVSTPEGEKKGGGRTVAWRHFHWHILSWGLFFPSRKAYIYTQKPLWAFLQSMPAC